jgi:hypothetical protein
MPSFVPHDFFTFHHGRRNIGAPDGHQGRDEDVSLPYDLRAGGKPLLCSAVGVGVGRVRVRWSIAALAIASFTAQSAFAQSATAQRNVTAPATPPESANVAAARAIEGAPAMDGDVLNDPVWALVQPVSGFTQTAPNEGEPGTEKTEVRMAFTADTLYVGVICYDREPTSIIVNDSRRDSSLTDSDSFQLILDTFRDRQNGFVFGTSPSGQQYDGQVIKEGTGGSGLGGGGSSEGGGGGFNLNWDGAWQVQAATSDIGWSATPQANSRPGASIFSG